MTQKNEENDALYTMIAQHNHINTFILKNTIFL